MVTVRINIKNHLQEYLIGKFGLFDNQKPIQFPDNTDIYHVIWDLLEKRPTNSIDTGNLEIVLPYRHNSKNPEYYNYLGKKAQGKLEKRIEIMMWSEFREFIEFEKQQRGTPYIESIFMFLKKYGITSISEDALKKNYYRWRSKLYRKEKRMYFFKKKHS